MRQIQVFDPPLCCSTGVCGAEVDQQLVTFAGDAAWAVRQGLALERFNLAQQPVQFATRPLVRRFLEEAGPEALPLVLVDGAIAMSGRCPSRAELSEWAGVPLSSPRGSGLTYKLSSAMTIGFNYQSETAMDDLETGTSDTTHDHVQYHHGELFCPW